MDDRARYVALLRCRFDFFLRFAFQVIGGDGEYHHNWHIDAIIHELDRCRRGENRRLIVTMPPRHLKSLTISIAWIAWMLGHNPALRFIAVSYGGDLAEKQGRDMLRVLEHPLYRAAFPNLVITRRSAQDLETSKGGGRLSTSLGGTLTGRGADYIVIDDPTKSRDAASDVVREADREWLLNTLMTRLNNPATGVIILVMQRLHQGDLVGVLQEQGGWHELRLPAIASCDMLIPIGEGRTYQRRAGHALHPARQPLAALEEQRRAMGSYNFEAQYQQEPVPASGNMIRREWLKTYDPVQLDRTRGRIIQSWDTAGKDNLDNDWSVCVTALVVDRRIYLLDVSRARLTFPDLRVRAIGLARCHRPQVLLIEDQSSGTQLIQTLRSEAPRGVPEPIGRRPDRDKLSRVAGISAMIEAGQLFLPREAAWLAAFCSELLGFPNARHDDQVDALAQLMTWVRDREFGYDIMVSAPIYGHLSIN
jgi:predicted phage terminase large subunit-like protein